MTRRAICYDAKAEIRTGTNRCESLGIRYSFSMHEQVGWWLGLLGLLPSPLPPPPPSLSLPIIAHHIDLPLPSSCSSLLVLPALPSNPDVQKPVVVVCVGFGLRHECVAGDN